ncbi:MAG: type IV secretory system conjugative DNA transfer family protein, partial [Lachnospiraceae bacterium]|nr:type IV secretory system conjugative DNA transfer family protein [Lachnospiraceae bacterium]
MPIEGAGAPSNNNMLIIGSSGSYKTTSVLTPNILLAQSNFIMLDVKGELQYKYGLYLQSMGYTIRSLNIKDQKKSDRYNPFEYIECEEDLIKLVANIYDTVTPEGPTANDPFWTDGPMLYLQAIFFYEWTVAKKEGRTGTVNNILRIINEEMMEDKTVKVKKGEKPPTILQKKMDELAKECGEMTPAVRDYRKFKAGAAETVRSIIIIVNAKLKLCETKGLMRIF